MIKEIAETLKTLTAGITLETVPGVVFSDTVETGEWTCPCMVTDFDVEAAGSQAAFQFNGVYKCTARWTLIVSSHDTDRAAFLAAADALERQTALFTDKNPQTREAFEKSGLRLLSAFVLTQTSFSAGTTTTSESNTFTVDREFNFAE